MHYLNKPVAAICLAVASAFVQAQEATYDFNIPAQPAGQVLNALSKQTGLQPFFTEDSVKGVQSPGVKGKYSLREALGKALAGTGLSYQFTAEKAVAIKGAAASPVIAVAKPVEASTELSPITVTATRSERRVDEVPASVSVLTEKALATKNRQNIYDALRDFEGLDFVAQRGIGHQVSPQIRGFSDSGKATQVLVDGIAVDSAVSQVMGRGGLNFTAPQDVERVEVVRGPASALYGPSTLGGVINVIPKRWKGAPGAEVNATYGSHNTYTLGAAVGMAREAFDIRLSVYDAKSDGYVAAPVKNSSGQWDLGPRPWEDKKYSLLMGFRPADNHELTVAYQQYATESAGYGGRINDGQTMDGNSSTLGYRYDLNESTNIKLNYRQTHLKQNYYFDNWDWNGLATPNVVTAADLAKVYEGERDSRNTAFQAILETRPFEGNQLILGLGRETGDHRTWGKSTSSATKTISRSESTIDSVFLQDEQRLGNFTLYLGVRNDRIDLSPDTVNGVPKNGSGSVENVVNPRVGARYKLTDATSVYASYGTAYVPALNLYRYVQPSTTRVDNPDLKPESSKTYEIGMNNRFGIGNLRTAIFQTEYVDKITLGIDPVSGMNQWQNIAFVKIEGVEIAYQGELGNGWFPYANFSYTKARDYAKDGATGTQSTRIAPRKFNAGLTYAPGDAWSATLNARYVSGLYFNNLTEAQWADGYTQVDFKVSMKFPIQGQKLEAFLAVNNLADKKYESFNKMEWTDGRTFTVGLNGRF